MERYTLEDHEAYRKEQDEKAAKEAEERQERTEKESARRAWLADGGNARDFEREWPKLRDQGRRERVLHAARRAREEVTEEHVTTLRRASPTTASRSPYPQSEDPLGQVAYTAAALRGLAEAVARLQGNEARSSTSPAK